MAIMFHIKHKATQCASWRTVIQCKKIQYIQTGKMWLRKQWECQRALRSRCSTHKQKENKKIKKSPSKQMLLLREIWSCKLISRSACLSTKHMSFESRHQITQRWDEIYCEIRTLSSSLMAKLILWADSKKWINR